MLSSKWCVCGVVFFSESTGVSAGPMVEHFFGFGTGQIQGDRQSCTAYFLTSLPRSAISTLLTTYLVFSKLHSWTTRWLEGMITGFKASEVWSALTDCTLPCFLIVFPVLFCSCRFWTYVLGCFQIEAHKYVNTWISFWTKLCQSEEKRNVCQMLILWKCGVHHLYSVWR